MKTRKADCMCGTYDYKPHFKTDPHGSAVINKPQPPAHTPGPWKVSQTGKFVMHSRPGTVLNVCEASEADAAHIVRCVNSHEELLTALKSAAKVIHLGHIAGMSHENVGYFFEDCGHIKCEPYRQAIAKAEGK